MRKLFLLFLPLLINAQDVPIGYWKDYQSYASASYIAEAENKIYCVTNGGLFYINKDDNTINRMSKVVGLSDVGIKHVAYSKELEITVITYSNCNIDLIKNNTIVNISDIKRKEIIGNKFINNIIIKEKIAYLSCTFGLVLIDLEKEEIKDTYKLYWEEELLSINETALFNDSIHLATSNGLYYAAENSNTLNDYNEWIRKDNPGDPKEFIGIVSNKNTLSSLSAEGRMYWWGFPIWVGVWQGPLTSGVSKVTATNDQILFIFDNKIMFPGYENTITTQSGKFKHAIMDKDSIIWVADSINGLLKYVNYEYQENFIPEGPKENRIFSLEYANNRLYVPHGGHISFGTLWNKNGLSVMNNTYDWRNYDYYELGNCRDIVNVAANKGSAYIASYYNGLAEIKENEFTVRYSNYNTNGALDTITDWQNDKRMAVADVKFDNNDNLWGLVSSVDHPLFVKTKDGTWISYLLSPSKKFLFDELLIDKNNQKWGIMGRGNSIFVFNDNNTLEDKTDDQYKILSMEVGNGNLPSLDIYSFAEDLDGEIWIGSNSGIAVFYNPSAIFSGQNFDAQQIIIQQGDYGQYLMNDEKVKCIKVDGANRKWIGTEKSGVFLLSEDGLKEIQHFTAQNSSLFSNNIIDITINPNSGEVYIGTEKGLISYRSDATSGAILQQETHVFPNPVRENYNGPIAIKGLVRDANIKITDIDGNLVFEDFANGGQAIWNGKNRNGERVSTGIYLVFSTDINGLEKMVSKILFIH